MSRLAGCAGFLFEYRIRLVSSVYLRYAQVCGSVQLVDCNGETGWDGGEG